MSSRTSATSGGAATEDSWRARPGLSRLMRLAIYGVPLLAGIAVSWLIGALLPAEWNGWLLFALRAAAAVLASMLVAGATTRLMPLAMLLRMTMIFPDVAPSRLAVARRTTSVKELTRRLEHGEPSEREAATTMLALVTALDRHDRKTRGHSERVRLFCDLLGEELGLDPADRGRLRWAALVHDIGKLSINERILNKPASLSEREWVEIKAHPDTGARLAQPLAAWLGPWYRGIPEHHERYDGTGYPRGLAGDAISLAGRAIAVVDAFETMTAARAYKSPMSTWSARAELTASAGSHFDPVMVRAFLQIALPRVLRVVGPLAFLVNAPLLRVLGQAPVRAMDAAAGASQQAISAAGVTAVAVAVSAAPAGMGHRATNEVQVADLGWRPSGGTAARPSSDQPDRRALVVAPAAADVRKDRVAPVAPRRSRATRPTAVTGGNAQPAEKTKKAKPAEPKAKRRSKPTPLVVVAAPASPPAAAPAAVTPSAAPPASGTGGGDSGGHGGRRRPTPSPTVTPTPRSTGSGGSSGPGSGDSGGSSNSGSGGSGSGSGGGHDR